MLRVARNEVASVNAGFAPGHNKLNAALFPRESSEPALRCINDSTPTLSGGSIERALILVFVMMGLTIYEKEQCIRPVPESGLHGKQSRVSAIAASTKFKEFAERQTEQYAEIG